MSFRNAIHEIVDSKLRMKTDPVQGYIPSEPLPDGSKAINESTNTCIVRIPNPHGGMHPGDNNSGSYIELRDVALPFYFKGLIGGLLSLLTGGGDRGVLVGFKGGNMAFPYIVSPLFNVTGPDKTDRTVNDRKPVTKDRATNVGGSHQVVTPDITANQLPSVTSFEDLISPGDTIIPPSSIDISKLSVFSGSQTNLASMIFGATTRDATPTVVSTK